MMYAFAKLSRSMILCAVKIFGVKSKKKGQIEGIDLLHNRTHDDPQHGRIGCIRKMVVHVSSNIRPNAGRVHHATIRVGSLRPAPTAVPSPSITVQGTDESRLPLWRVGLCSGGSRTGPLGREPDESFEEVLLASVDVPWGSFVIRKCVLDMCDWDACTEQVFFVQEEYLEIRISARCA